MLAFMGAVSACVNDDYVVDEVIKTKASKEGLTISPVVSESSLVVANTRDNEEEPDLKEKDLNTLDVFVEGVTTTTFWKQYHLPYSDGESVQEQVQNFLANSWRKEGLKEGEKYNIYVAANNPLTTENIANVSALKELTYSEVEEGIAVVDEATNNISWPWTEQFAHTPSGFIYKQYVAESEASAVAVDGDLYGFTTEKEFMMDGVIKDWTPNPNSQSQEFDVTMNRAAAKIVLNVKFDADFLKSLTHEKKTVDGVETWVEKPDAKQVTITGTPAWRFYNFAFGAPVFTPDTTPTAGVEVHSSATLLRHPYEYSGDNKSFQIITYSYPNVWAKADYATKAPSLVLSVGYKEGGVTNYHYYRVPLVKSTVTSIDRNTIYVINATIATRGSETHEDVIPIEDLTYAVLPWNDETNSAAMSSEVESVQHYYFKVNPKVYTLRGDGDQSVVLNYLKASGTKVNWKLFTYDSEGNQTAVVDKGAEGATRAWFYNAQGDFITTYGDSKTEEWPNMGVTITQSTEGTSGSSGTITVTSTALTNKAIKYIRLRVYLDEKNDQGQPLEGTYHEDIIIRHFPTDNIQNISGSWSSYHDASGSTGEITLRTRSLATAESWVEEFGKKYSTKQITTTDDITYANYSAHAGEEGYAIAAAQATTNRSTFRTQVQDNDRRRAANGQANAVLGEDGYCYWGVNPSSSDWYWNDNDYYIEGYFRNEYYRYGTLYRAHYTHTYTYTEYSMTVIGSSTGDWVDWDAADKDNHSERRSYQITYNNSEGFFNAKVLDGNSIYRIEENSHGSGYNRYYSTDHVDNAENNPNYHMYVIQISSTSDEYVLGRPYVNPSTHQSQDNVVSPAFMIASQLGTVRPFEDRYGPADAATHCSRYMEVAQDGTRYTGWRLPTEAEISVITSYQYGKIGGVEIPSQYQVIVPVLTGMWYHSLSGQEVEANPDAGQGSQTKSYLRCVRDLSSTEVDRLNGFEKIQEKYK